jgi:hypothetical protein
MVKNAMIILLLIGAYILVGCGASETEKADSIEDITGTWRRVQDGSAGEGYYQFSDDGTYLTNQTLEQIDSGTGFVGDYWYEGTQIFIQETGGPGVSCPEVAGYEIHLESSDNLKWVLSEDACTPRASWVAGEGAEEGSVEWERVP